MTCENGKANKRGDNNSCEKAVPERSVEEESDVAATTTAGTAATIPPATTTEGATTTDAHLQV